MNMSKNTSQHIDDQFQSLLQAVEGIRKERFPDLEAEVVRELLRIHANGSIADAEIARETERRVEAYLAKGV
jgi:hypothetical protein